MSKIYDKYLELKKENKDTLYLFHTGKFYIFIAEDADFINEYVVLKKTRFTNEIDKCGFPEERLDNYLRVFNNHNLPIEIVEARTININITTDKMLKRYKKIEKYINSIDYDNITPLQSLEKLIYIKRCFDE